MGKKSKRIPDFDISYLLQVNADDKRFGRIFEGMLKSEKYKMLKPGAKNLFVVCIVHCATVQNHKTLFAHKQAEGLENEKYTGGMYFILTQSQLSEYKIDAKHAYRHFAALENAGFIDVVEHNQHRKKENVYRISSRWKQEQT